MFLIFPLYFWEIPIFTKYKGKINKISIAYFTPKMNISRNTNHVTLMYSKSLFYKSTLRILKKIMGRGLGGPQNPEKWEKWVKIQTSGHGSRVKKTFLRLHTPGFSIWYIYLVIQGSGQKFWDNFEKKGPPNGYGWIQYKKSLFHIFLATNGLNFPTAICK